MQLPSKILAAIDNFAKAYEQLEEAGIIRSRRIVGDIGEFYACRRLNLEASGNKNQKGFDAIDKKGRTFEIKTRRVYESGRRTSETRRINNLVGKDAKYLIVVPQNAEIRTVTKSLPLKFKNSAKGLFLNWLSQTDENVKYTSYIKNKNTTWYIFFTYHPNDIYYIRYATNNHVAGHLL